jgi:hypothetical protein
MTHTVPVRVPYLYVFFLPTFTRFAKKDLYIKNILNYDVKYTCAPAADFESPGSGSGDLFVGDLFMGQLLTC